MPKKYVYVKSVALLFGLSKNNCNNYRVITISSCIRKVFSTVLYRLITYLDDNRKLSDNQAAYRKSCSTIDHLYILKSIINKYVIHNKAKLYCCFVDFNKAFDSIPREYLFLKLLCLGIGRKLYTLIRHTYSNTQSCLKLREGLTPFSVVQTSESNKETHLARCYLISFWMTL